MKQHIILLQFVLTIFPLFNLQSQNFLHGEILGRPTNNSISVNLVPGFVAEISIKYGLQRNELSQQTPWFKSTAIGPMTIVLDQLEPNNRYYYQLVVRIQNGVEQLKPIRQFHTQRNPGDNFVFIVQADPHLDEQSDTTLYRRTLLNEVLDSADFMIELGDFVMTDKLKNTSGKITLDTIESRTKLLRSYYEQVAHSTPLFLALGNHEAEAGWQLNGTANSIAIMNTNTRKTYFINPSPNSFYTGDESNYPFVGIRQSYYAWTWGDALFIVLDPYWFTSPKPDANTGWRWTLGKAQYDWLKMTLESNSSRYKFVFCHQLVGGDPDGRGGIEFADLYEWGGKNKDGSEGFSTNRPGWHKPIKELLKEHKVSIFFHGHDHFYGQQDKECLVYQECPQPSHPNYLNANQAAAYGYKEGKILPNAGHLRVTVQSENVKVEYIRSYTPENEVLGRKNRDIAATYFINGTECYDSLTTSTTVLWNTKYMNEIISPNPFSEETKIELPSGIHNDVTLYITDAQGNIIRRLLNRQQTFGQPYTVFWDGKNQSGSTMPNGIYFVVTQIHFEPPIFRKIIRYQP